MPGNRSGSMLGRITGLLGGKKPFKKMLQKYMEFYYPFTGASRVTYNIIFDWGEYIITTEASLDAAVHPDSKPYLGYITMRPEVAGTVTEPQAHIYLITSDGVVWENTNGEDIPATKIREEVSEKKSKFGVSRTTQTIQSVSEPLIDHFKAHPEKWTRFGKLEIHGGKTRLNLVE